LPTERDLPTKGVVKAEEAAARARRRKDRVIIMVVLFRLLLLFVNFETSLLVREDCFVFSVCRNNEQRPHVRVTIDITARGGRSCREVPSFSLYTRVRL